MFAPSPMATGRCTIADHFPGNQGKSGAGLVKQFLQEAGEWIKGDILLPHILLPFFFFFQVEGSVCQVQTLGKLCVN